MSGLRGLGMVAGVAVGVAACATTAPPPDVRGSAAVGGMEPQLLVAGPARLLHVNSDRRKVIVYRVRRADGTAADCHGARKESIVDWDQETDLLVHRDETICVAAEDRLGRLTQLSWHARQATGDVVETQQASLERD
jgi:hypothetical protein